MCSFRTQPAPRSGGAQDDFRGILHPDGRFVGFLAGDLDHPGASGSVRTVAQGPDARPDPRAQGTDPTGPPRGVRILGVLLLVEAAFVLVLAALQVVALFTDRRQTQLWVPLSEIALTLVAAIGLYLMARGLGRGRRWARSPAITLQLVGLPLCGRLIEYGGIRIALGVPLGLVVLATLVLLFATASPDGSEPTADPDAR
jgi:hypothetical protein